MLQTAFLTVAGYSLQAAIVILVVVLVRFVLRRLGAPTVVSYALWAVVLFRLLCPVSLESPVGVIPEKLAQVPQEQAIVDYEYVPTDVALMSGFLSLGDAMGGSVDGADFTYESETAGPNEDGYGRIFPKEALLLTLGALWPAGMAALVIYSAAAYLRLRRRLVGAVPLEGNIRLADHITSPFVMGLFRPKIYLPSDLPESEREYILLHEKHHIRRLDHIVKILAFAALCIHWFNPLVWLAFYLSGQDMEMSCDEAVVKKLGGGIRADYSASLLKLSTGRTVIAATPLAFGEGDTKSRIKNLAKWKKPAVWITVAAVILCAVVIVLCATNHSRETSLKIRMTSSGTEIACRFGNDVKDYAIYEDIYLEGERISSKPVLINGEHPNQADTSKKLNCILNAKTEFAETGGIAGKLTFCIEHETGAVSQRELDLPRERYTSCGRVWGDGSRKVTGARCELQENGEAILFSVILSTEPDGSVVAMDKKLGITGANDTVVQYRLVTADYVRDWPETANGNLYYDFYTEPPRQFGPDQIYVPERCLYMSPLSSFAAMGGDSGYRYVMGEDGFYMIRQDIRTAILLAEAGIPQKTEIPLAEGYGWAKWEEFPWTDEEWEAMFWPKGMWKLDISGCKEKKYCALSQGYCLLQMGDSLWLADITEGDKIGAHVWSIYLLVPESTKGSAQWEYAPMLSSRIPYFRFEVGMEYDEIIATCNGGTLSYYGAGEDEIGDAVTVPAGEALYWSPRGEDGSLVEQSRIHIAVQKDGVTACFATVYLCGDRIEETGRTVYTARLVGTGLVIAQSSEGEGAIIRLQ